MDNAQAAQLIQVLSRIADHLDTLVGLFFFYALIRLIFKK
jgi:hypothetical protein